MTKVSECHELTADVESLYANYCEALDDAQIGRWPSFFADKCLYRITTRENIERGMPLCFVLCEGQAMLRDRAAAIEKTVVYRRRFQRRMLSGLRLKTTDDLNSNGIEACASFAIFESVADAPSQLLVCGRTTDIIVREGGTLKFKQRLCVIDARIMPDSLVFPI